MWSPLLLLSLLAPADSPQVVRNTDRWILRNASLQCVLDRRRGGLPSQIADVAGRIYWQDAIIYSDWGPLAADGTVASTNCPDPELTAEEKDGALRVTAAGQLLRAGGGETRDAVRYRVRYILGSGPELQMRLELTTPVERAAASGFLALVAGTPGAEEWYARTLQGWAAERFGNARDRVWQSADEPLDPDRPELGVLWGDGRRLAVTSLRAEGPLENVFWHQSHPGAANLFLAFLCGSQRYSWRPGTPWSVEFQLRLGG